MRKTEILEKIVAYACKGSSAASSCLYELDHMPDHREYLLAQANTIIGENASELFERLATSLEFDEIDSLRRSLQQYGIPFEDPGFMIDNLYDIASATHETLDCTAVLNEIDHLEREQLELRDDPQEYERVGERIDEMRRKI